MDQAAPAYPIVVNVKLPAMTAPNGLAGCWRRPGLIASAMKPTGFMNDPTLIANTTSGDGDTRKWLNSRKKITSVASNEPVDGDWIITGDLTLKLRAERSNKRTSRIYTITIVCTDPAGNRSTKAVTVTVPRN